MTSRAERKRRLEDIGRYVYNRYRDKAMDAVYRAIKTGRLVHPSTLPCQDCDRQAEYYDHRHYDKPIEVAPVCHGCNLRRGMGSIDFGRINLDLAPFWGNRDVEGYMKLTGQRPYGEDDPAEIVEGAATTDSTMMIHKG